MRVERRAMKKLLLLGVGSALMFTMAGVGSAQADTLGTGSTHKSTAAGPNENQKVSIGGSRCAGCHRAHTAKAEMLLKQSQPSLCYTCHSSLGSNLNVVDGTLGASGGGALRGGGFEFALLDGAGAQKTYGNIPNGHGGYNLLAQTVPVLATGGVAVTSRHQIDGQTSGTMWGNGAVSDGIGGALDAGKAGVTLECASCHDPHGNGNYRLLKPIPNDAATKGDVASLGSPQVNYVAPVTAVAEVFNADGTVKTAAVIGVTEVPFKAAVAPHGIIAAVVVAPVNIPDAVGPRVYTTDNYWAVADRSVPLALNDTMPLAATATDGYITNVSAWCTTCHTRYLAGSGSHATPLTNAAGTVTDTTFTYRHRSDASDRGGANRPNCIQCHVSHGTNVVMSGYAGASYAQPDGKMPTAKGSVGNRDAAGALISSATAAPGTSRLLRVDNRGTCEMCHNV